MYDWRLVNMAQEHCKDLLREAEQERLARLALQGRPSRGRLYGRALLRLGRRLAGLGSLTHLAGGRLPERARLHSSH
jgi:hypothetical protein